MISPCRRHYEKKTAAAQSAVADDQRPLENANQYELMLAKLAEDKRRLHDIQSMEKRADLKAKLLPDYAPWVEGVLAGDQGVQDDVLITVMVWLIDIGALQEAVTIAEYAIRHNLSMPDQYQRLLPVVVAEEVADISIKAKNAGDTPIHTSLIAKVIELTAAADMPDQVRAKLHKAYAYGLDKDARVVEGKLVIDMLKQALDQFKRAVALYEKVGVKKDMENLEREIKNSANS